MIRRTQIISIALLLTSLIVALAAVELVARLFLNAPEVYRLKVGKGESAFMRSADPLLGYELKPNFRGSPKICHHSFPFTNADGQRDLERTVAKAPGIFRVALLGDSVVAGHGECDFSKTLSSTVERALPNSEVLNFGVGGYCTLSEVQLFKKKGLRYKPDLVAVVFVGNDYLNANSHPGAVVSFDRPPLVNELFLHSDLFRYSALRFNFFEFSSEFQPTTQISDLGDNVDQGLRLLKQLEQQEGFKALIILWPYFTDRGIESPHRKVVGDSSLGPEIEQLAEQHGFPVLDLKPVFEVHYDQVLKSRANPNKRPKPRWIYTQGDGVHPSELGTTVASPAIAAALATSR